MKFKKIDLSILLLIIGAVMAVIAGFSMIKAQEYYNQLVPVIFAGQSEITQFSIIKEEDIQLVKVPKIIAQRQNLITKKEDIVGKVAGVLISAQTPIVKTQLLDFERNNNILAASLSQLNDPSVVAYTVPASQNTCFGGKILPNDMVHIIATIQPPETSIRNKEFVSKIVVPYAKVLDVVRVANGKQMIISGITFALTPQQVLDIEYVRKNGTITFALLPYTFDKDNAEIVTTDETFGERYFSRNSDENEVNR